MATDRGRPDLNLLIPLNALLVERNVTKAAERLSMAQPTMSTTLAKLRRHFGDPLLIREGRTLVLTPFAESLRQPVQTALVAALDALSFGHSFDSRSEQRSFTVIASDYAACTLLRPALRELTADAPGVRVNVEPLRADLIEQLRSGRCDLLFWPLQLAGPDLLGFPHESLFTDEFIAVADKDHHVPEEPLTAKALAQTPAVQVNGVGGNRVVSEVKLSEQTLRQPTAITVESFTLALGMVAGSDRITLTQRRLFDLLGPALGLREVPLAIPHPPLNLAMFWHPNTMHSPAHQWFRGRLRQMAAQM
ncbi:LysR family transcriptional regulator [Streptomyces cyaneochromogenes]|uniref:LysR family transcriptional regulator n=1 Tax=Streptomyces cyaneochromogenes TaxID=2496836 RepID=UPI00158DCEF3|nr:LysR family transcriptional regulator [Streptomyces cyaneochromogenes]